jgi:hypothetical protein
MTQKWGEPGKLLSCKKFANILKRAISAENRSTQTSTQTFGVIGQTPPPGIQMYKRGSEECNTHVGRFQ